MKIKFRPKYQGAGPVGLNGIQYVNEDAMLNSQQANLDTLFSINGMANPYNRAVQNAPSSLMPNGPINPVQGSGLSIVGGDMGEDIVNPLSGNRVTDYAGTGNNYGTVLTNPNFQVQNGVQGAGQQTGSTSGTQTSTQTGSQTGSQTGGGGNNPQDGNPLNPMSMPYFMPDLTSRAQMMGRAIGNIRTAKETGNTGLGAAGILGTVASGLSLGMGLAREIAGASSEQYAAARDFREQQRRLAEERRNAMITYQQQGGGINIGNGQRVDTSSLTGEYIYPLPKSMEENANVEIEKGEYALTPDVVGPMEAKGEKHSNGGTPVSLPEAYIISDYRKIPEDFAASIRETYGIKASPKDSYASLIDKYKNKIGLKKKYEEQEKAIARLEKNQSVKDTNTSVLNKSILSKYINDNQKEIDDLETELRDFAEMVYKRQEDDKREEEMKFFFRDGGQFKPSTLKKTAKALGVSVDEARNMIFDSYKKRKKMPGGGDTEKNRRMAASLNRYFNGPINYGLIYKTGYNNILNEGESYGILNDQGYQSITGGNSGNYYYGKANEESITDLLDLNRWARGYNENGDFLDHVSDFQNEYNRRISQFTDILNSGNFTVAPSYSWFGENIPQGIYESIAFLGDDAGSIPSQNPQPREEAYTGDLSNSVYNSRNPDDKYGQYTATRPFYSLGIVTKDELKKLRDNDIRNFVDIRNNPDKVRELLGNSDSMRGIERMLSDEDFNDFDFIIGERTTGNAPVIEKIPVPDSPVPDRLPVSPTRSPQDDFDLPPQVQTLEVPDEEVELPDADEVLRQNPLPKQPKERTSRGNIGAGLVFPEILRDRQNGLIVEGLERHYAPRVDPVLRSADQYINELNRATSSQLDAIGDVPDSQRAAIMANMNAIAGSNIARYINEVDLYNAQQRNEADRFNQISFRNTQDANIQERQRYEAGTLQAMAIYDENRARYLDNLNQEAQQKFNTQTRINALQSAFPNMRITPSGGIVYDDNGQPVLMGGDWSTRYLMAMAMAQQQNNRRKNGTTSTTSTTATGGASR